MLKLNFKMGDKLNFSHAPSSILLNEDYEVIAVGNKEVWLKSKYGAQNLPASFFTRRGACEYKITW